jgi:hypothetical protein
MPNMKKKSGPKMPRTPKSPSKGEKKLMPRIVGAKPGEKRLLPKGPNTPSGEKRLLANTTTKAPGRMLPKPKTTKKPEKMTPQDAAMKKILEKRYGKIYG